MFLNLITFNILIKIYKINYTSIKLEFKDLKLSRIGSKEVRVESVKISKIEKKLEANPFSIKKLKIA